MGRVSDQFQQLLLPASPESLPYNSTKSTLQQAILHVVTDAQAASPHAAPQQACLAAPHMLTTLLLSQSCPNTLTDPTPLELRPHPTRMCSDTGGKLDELPGAAAGWLYIGPLDARPQRRGVAAAATAGRARPTLADADEAGGARARVGRAQVIVAAGRDQAHAHPGRCAALEPGMRMLRPRWRGIALARATPG